MKLGAMISGGKDSWYATYKESKDNEIVCLIRIISLNPDSYMFHTPNMDAIELQSKVAHIPLLTHKTKGEKEKELEDLKEALIRAKTEFKIEGIVTGALFSRYQKDRIDKICDEIGIKSIAPLWHMDQEKLLYELLENNFKFIISSIAADGLSEKWLGRTIDTGAIQELVEINKKIGMNIAFEGGEAESLVLKCPLFKKEIIVIKAVNEMENEFTGRYIIEKTELS